MMLQTYGKNRKKQFFFYFANLCHSSHYPICIGSSQKTWVKEKFFILWANRNIWNL